MANLSLPIGLAVLLVLGLIYAAVADWRRREVSDRVWQVLAGVGTVVGAFAFGSAGVLPLALWLVAGALVLEHLFPWDEGLERWRAWAPGVVELAVYAAVVGGFLFAALRYGIGPSTVTSAALAVVVSVILARGLFEIGILYGGADAKALMVAGLLVPMFTVPYLPVPVTAQAVLVYYPYSLNLLMDAAVAAMVVPLAIAVRNLRAGQFEFPRGFTGYRIPVAELPDSFVWLKDPLAHPEPEEAETSEEDRAVRVRQAKELAAQGVQEVWVTPQLPFIVLLAVGAVLGLLVGNVVFDLAALL
jgi:hypothetical protein